MKDEDTNNRSETFADIESMLQKHNGETNPPWVHFTEDGGLDVTNLIDRIEAAAKRDAAIHAMTCEANERLREHLEIALEDDKWTVGNAAAMREALELFAHMNDDGFYDKSPVVRSIVNKARAALAEPPRNCDRFDDLKSAQRHYVEHGCLKGLGMLVDGEIRKAPWKSQFEKWLFASATEQKGETDGSK